MEDVKGTVELLRVKVNKRRRIGLRELERSSGLGSKNRI